MFEMPLICTVKLEVPFVFMLEAFPIAGALTIVLEFDQSERLDVVVARHEKIQVFPREGE